MSGLLIEFVSVLTFVMWVAILGRVIMSWVSVDRSSPFYPVVAIIYEITEPILGPIRSVLPNLGMIDLSPMVALLLMGFIRQILLSALN